MLKDIIEEFHMPKFRREAATQTSETAPSEAVGNQLVSQKEEEGVSEEWVVPVLKV
eukprot:CAMPEP_0170502830 /NCGR_PEP_ID=MMETSP0208-20121228/42680_1 /TAXON_ID=197538 /ORGANISM="Strombidium inclinatum, Strain S3" /LENGTH=55 /DNA_ID=CAMNT_0010782127 /DNA_START=345 /DNA_END=512 /DNA_ORIENTATION=+